MTGVGGVRDNTCVSAGGVGGRAAGRSNETLLGAGLDAVQCGTARRVGRRVFPAFAELFRDGVTALVPVPLISPTLLVQVQLPCALSVWVELPAHQEVWR